MRATEKKLRDRHARLPEQYKKVDTTSTEMQNT